MSIRIPGWARRPRKRPVYRWVEEYRLTEMEPIMHRGSVDHFDVVPPVKARKRVRQATSRRVSDFEAARVQRTGVRVSTRLSGARVDNGFEGEQQ